MSESDALPEGLPDTTPHVSAIADAAEAAAPFEYDLLFLSADFEFEDAVAVTSHARVRGEKVPLYVGSGVHDRFRELRQAFRAVEHPLWVVADVSVDAEGEVRAKFHYPTWSARAGSGSG